MAASKQKKLFIFLAIGIAAYFIYKRSKKQETPTPAPKGPIIIVGDTTDAGIAEIAGR